MRSLSVLYLALCASSVLALPAVFVKETCLCEPVQQTFRSISPPLSCVRTAAKISNWRALSFHRPELADKFVDMTALDSTKQHPDPSRTISASHGIRKTCHSAFNRIKLAMKAWKHNRLSPRTSLSKTDVDYVPPISQLDGFHFRTPHRLSHPGSSRHTSNPVKIGSSFSDDSNRRWKVVCYARPRADVPHSFHSTFMAFAPFVFLFAFIASLRARGSEDSENEKN